MTDASEATNDPPQAILRGAREQCRFVRLSNENCTILVPVEKGDTKQLLKTHILRALAACDFPERLVFKDIIECQPEDISIVPLHGSSHEFEPWVSVVRDGQRARFGVSTDTGLLVTFPESGRSFSMSFVAFGFKNAASLETEKAENSSIDVGDPIKRLGSKDRTSELALQEELEGLCDNCASISVDILNSPTGHTWDVGSDGTMIVGHCELCHILNREIRSLMPAKGSKSLGTFEMSVPSVDVTAQLVSLRLEPCTVQDPRPCARLRYQDHKGQYKIAGALDLFTIPDDAATTFGIPAKRHLLNTKSSQTVETACNWIRNCLHHCECFGWSRFNAWEQSQHPKRLLDLHAFKEHCHDLQLVDYQAVVRRNSSAVQEPLTSILGTRRLEMLHIVYATVSHCWGSGVSIRTTPSTLGSHKMRIHYNELPQTFRECADFARALGLRYLWIDALCIVQDSPVEWTIESRKMGAIYGGAFINLSADMSRDSNDGLFNESSTTQDTSGKVFQITNKLPDGRTSTLSLWHRPMTGHSPVMDEITGAPLASRAWVCQERCLSQRVLHFTSAQVIWECRRGLQSEDNLRTFPLGTPSASGFLLQRSGNNTAEADRIRAWYKDIVEDSYSNRLLSHEADRLPALSGLARYFSRWLSQPYIAGTWLSSPLAFLFGLAWRRANEAYARPSIQRGPTWSWVSVEGAVAWPDSFHIAENVRVRLIEPAVGADLLGRQTSAPISLQSYTGQATIWPAKPLSDVESKSSYTAIEHGVAFGFASNRHFEPLDRLRESSIFAKMDSLSMYFDSLFPGGQRPGGRFNNKGVYHGSAPEGVVTPHNDEHLIINCYQPEHSGRPAHTFPACLITSDKAPLGPAWLDDCPVQGEVTICVIGRTKYSQIVLLLQRFIDGDTTLYRRCGIAEILDAAKMRSFTDGLKLQECEIV